MSARRSTAAGGRLQREQLLPRSRADRNTVGDRTAGQIIEWATLAIAGEPGVVDATLDPTLILQCATAALRDVFDEDLKVLWAGSRHLPEHRLPGLVDRAHAIEEEHVEVPMALIVALLAGAGFLRTSEGEAQPQPDPP